jgi:hypothetical protein
MSEVSPIISEIVEGNGLSMSDAGRIVPALRGNRRTNPATIWRWVCRGHRLPDGSVIKLEAAKLAGRWLTSRAALARFLERVTAASTPVPPSDPKPVATPRSETRRRKAVDAATAKLIAAGA